MKDRAPRFRLWIRTTAVVGSVLLGGAALLVLHATPLLGRARRLRLCRGVFRLWSRVLLRICGLRLRVQGTPPSPPFLLVSNHQGYVDVPVLASLARCTFVAQAEIRSWPLFGICCRGVGTIFLRREARRDISRVLGEIDAARAIGSGVVIFPEGTTSSGESVRHFHPSLLSGAAAEGLAVHHVTLSYRTPPGADPAREAVCWWGGMQIYPHMKRLLMLPGIACRVRFGERPVAAPDRKELAGRLHAEVSARFLPAHPRKGAPPVHAPAGGAAGRPADGQP